MSQAKREEGFTILELSIAIAVFMVVLGVAAQALVSFYVAVDMQHQKQEAVRACTSVLNDMRVVRDANPGDFPDAIVALFPNNGLLQPGDEVQLNPDITVVPNEGTLRNQLIRVEYADDSANPLQVEIIVTCDSLRGHPVRTSVSTMLTNR